MQKLATSVGCFTGAPNIQHKKLNQLLHLQQRLRKSCHEAPCTDPFPDVNARGEWSSAVTVSVEYSAIYLMCSPQQPNAGTSHALPHGGRTAVVPRYFHFAILPFRLDLGIHSGEGISQTTLLLWQHLITVPQSN